jgi:hypothetical protein
MSAGDQASRRELRSGKFRTLFAVAAVDLNELRKLLWSGVPSGCVDVHATAWTLSLGYLPLHRDRQEATLARKRAEYLDIAREHYESEKGGNDALLVQIRKDLPRTIPCGEVFSEPRIHASMERALYVWSVRNPASGYVQGINDMLALFLVVFLSRELGASVVDGVEIKDVSDDALTTAEADSYWCLSKVLSEIQDHYTSGQPGIQRMIIRLKTLVRRIDEELFNHLEANQLSFEQFAFRWMNNLLLREIPLHCSVRLWDTYIAEENGFGNFHIYVCAVFLVYWSPQLKQMDFEQLLLFLQKVPTADWTDVEIETLLAEAFILKELFQSSPSHFNN